MQKKYSFYYGEPFEIYNIDQYIEDLNYSLEWNELNFKFYSTPGHSPGSICIGIDHFLFTGDTLIKGLRTIVKLPDSNKAKLANYIDFILNNFPKNTLIYPGHGNHFRLEEVNREIVLGLKKNI